MSEVVKSKYAHVLNELNYMQESMVYAARRSTLEAAERIIVYLETALTKALAAPPAVWSRERPTVGGYWWFKGEGGTWIRHIKIVPANWGGQHLTPYDDYLCQFVENIGGEWSGPLRPPVEGK